MTRYMFGGTGGDFVTDSSGNYVSGASGSVWTARSGGVRVVDLRDADGNALAATGVIISVAAGQVIFYGPDDDGATTQLWVDFGGGARVLVKPADPLVGRSGVPDGGATGQVLVKQSGSDGDIGWNTTATLSDETPTSLGGTASPGSTGLASDAGHSHGTGTLLDGIVEGLLPPFGWKSGYYYGPPGAGSAGTKGALEHERLHFCPLDVPNDATVDRIRFYVDNGGDSGNVTRLGIYSPDSYGWPSALVVDAGTVGTDTTGAKEVTVNQALTRGRYWIAFCSQVAASACGVRQANAANYMAWGIPAPDSGTTAASFYSTTPVSGALPATATNVSPHNRMPFLQVRVQ